MFGQHRGEHVQRLVGHLAQTLAREAARDGLEAEGAAYLKISARLLRVPRPDDGGIAGRALDGDRDERLLEFNDTYLGYATA